jgi:tRNA(His) guanylyltransferase
MIDTLGDHLKALEKDAALPPLPADRPVYARLDGRGFSRLTRGMTKPFDARMTRAMEHTARTILEKTHALAAYTQSDEISLVWEARDLDSELFFGGKPAKLTSVLAGLATAAFSEALRNDKDGLAAWLKHLPHFDCRVLSCPDRDTAADFFRWRGQDARRNAIQMIAQSVFSHRQLHGKSITDQLTMLKTAGITPKDFADQYRHGTLMTRRKVLRRLTVAEHDAIPEKHRPARDHKVYRSQTLDFSERPPQGVTNLVAVLFEDATPDVAPASNEAAQIALCQP